MKPGDKVRGINGASSCRDGGRIEKRDQHHDNYWWVRSDSDGHLYCLHAMDIEVTPCA